ncbi:Flp family type IVb pilin [Dyella japonica]|uniref:Pilin n=1 Tax=Dyella japonica A8 TaxID=1217721 RepID=A0A075JXE5_9GAMM|nr:Flp family type IVb pilin [Dyella japonica]AIF46564.1 pilin [Dyella japonica A8]
MNTMIRKFLTEEDGITAVEYGILAAVVAVAILAIFGGTGANSLQGVYTTIMTALTNAVNKA